jgi:hypothetical protein
MTENPGEDSELDLNGLLLSEDGIVELSDKLTAYMTEIELGGMPDIIGQVLDDFLDQCGGMPEDLKDPSAFDQITRNQLAVTLAYQLGRLEGRSPQVVRLLIQQVINSFGSHMVQESPEILDKDLDNPKELVYPRLRRLEYPESLDDDC